MLKKDTEIKNIYLSLKGGVLDFRGNSMEPTLKDGYKVMVKPVEPEHVRAGDIIVFKGEANDGLVCHRALARFRQENKLYFLEKGDNSRNIGSIAGGEIIGRLAYIMKNEKPEKPGFYIDRKSILFYLLDFFIYPYIRISGFIKNRIFFGKKNPIAHILGTIIWRLYYFFFNILYRR